MLEQLSSESGEEREMNLLGVGALLFYENDCIISLRVGGRLLNDPVSGRAFLPLQTHLSEIITMIRNCHPGLPSARHTAGFTTPSNFSSRFLGQNC